MNKIKEFNEYRKIKNSLKTGSDKDGYFGEYGGIAAGENLMNNLEELKKAFEAAIKDKKFLDEFGLLLQTLD